MVNGRHSNGSLDFSSMAHRRHVLQLHHNEPQCTQTEGSPYVLDVPQIRSQSEYDEDPDDPQTQSRTCPKLHALPSLQSARVQSWLEEEFFHHIGSSLVLECCNEDSTTDRPRQIVCPERANPQQ